MKKIVLGRQHCWKQLLETIADFGVEKMPLHHHILHVRQDIQSAGWDTSVLQAVMDTDIERNTVIGEKKKLLKRLEGGWRDKE